MGTAFARRAPLQITFTEPQIASVGANWKELEPRKTEIAVGSASFTNSGRSQLARSGDGAMLIDAEKTAARLLGVELFAQDAEHLAHLFAFAPEQGADLGDLLKMPFHCKDTPVDSAASGD
jgi:dihydrolipoamide dehydrogenase